MVQLSSFRLFLLQQQFANFNELIYIFIILQIKQLLYSKT